VPVQVDIPTRLKVDVPALTARRADIEEAVAAAAGRALTASAAEVLEPRGAYVGAWLNEPVFSWSGDGLAAVPPALRADVEQALRDALMAAAEQAGIPRVAGADGTELLRPPTTRIDDDRYDPLLGLYALPVYNAGGANANVLVERRAARRVSPAPHVPVEWWPLTMEQAQLAYLWEAGHAGIEFPQSGYEGAIYAEVGGGIRIDLVKYPEMTWFSLTRFSLSEFVKDPASGKLIDKPAAQLPAVSSYWLDPVATRADGDPEPRLRAALLPVVREILKTESTRIISDEEFKAAVDARVQELIQGILADPASATVTSFMRLRIDGSSFLMRWGGDVPADFTTARLIPLVRPTGMRGAGVTGTAQGAEGAGGGAEGRGSATDPGGRGGAAAGGRGVEGGVTGARPVTELPSFIHVPGGKTTGSLFPPPTGDPVTQKCEAYLGEPSIDRLGPDGRRIWHLVETIAFRLQMEQCKFAGAFLLNAAEVLGSRAAQVEKWEVQDRGSMKTASAGAATIGNVAFIPTVGPQIQFMRHLATVVPLLSELKAQIDRVYRQRGDLIEGFWKDQSVSWLNRWHHDFVVGGMERHVGLLFVMTCNVIFRQLLNTSRQNIDDRDNEGFFNHFREVVLPRLEDLADLLRARDLLKSADTVAWTLPSGSAPMRHQFRDVTIAAEGAAPAPPALEAHTWDDAIERVLAAVAPYEGEEVVASTYVLLPQPGGGFQIRDRRGRVWELERLERWITLARGGLEEIEPLVKQLTEVPEIVERYRGLSADDANYETHKILDEMRDNNKEQSEKARNHPWTGFRASNIIENLAGATVPKTNYSLQGIHKQAHDLIGEFFRGDPFYGLAIEELFAGELGRKELASALELSFLVVLSVLCPPAGAGFGLGMAIGHYEEAKEKQEIYRSLIDPEKVITAAEVEASLFAAKLGLALAIIPVGSELAPEAKAIVRRIGGEVAEEAVAAAVPLTRAFESAGLRALLAWAKEGVIARIAIELGENWLMDKVTGAALEPIMRGLEAEWGATGPIGGLDGAMQRLIAQMASEDVEITGVGGGG
jgi:hypothetical protein